MLSKEPKGGDLLRVKKRWWWFQESDWTVMDSSNLGTSGNIVIPTFPLPGSTVSTSNITLQPGLHVVRKKVAKASRRITYHVRRDVSSEIPMDRSLLLISFKGTTLRFLLDDTVYRVTASCIEHIMNDFELVSGVEEALG